MYIYLDNAATTRQHPAVTDVMAKTASEDFFNSSALYPPSVVVKNKIQVAREVILKKLGGNSGDLVFTSGATESNNMVIFGKATKRTRILCLEGEHSSVYAPVKYLKDNGYDITIIPLQSDGRANLGDIRGVYDLVLFGLVNSDTGTIQDAKAIVQSLRRSFPKAHIHCDATQAFCKIPFNVVELDLDSASISGHKICGPKGIGALYLKKGVHLDPIMLGGGQQPIRPGTENNPAVLGFAKAVEVFNTNENFAHVSALHAHLIKSLPQGVTVNGINNNPYITNLQLSGRVLGQTVLNALAIDGILVGLGSACSGSNKSRTLSAMGISDQRAKQVLRISFCPENTAAEVDNFISKLSEILKKF
ncbi:MAG: cysteine desulfurase [Christensenellaceae bacterium]|jgi:cysteine desulfurase|nr:cysteine desulfurase [Christensenellaceae bacterium]